jgi:hypothetical protein
MGLQVDMFNKKSNIFAPARLFRQTKEMEPRMARISRMGTPSFLIRVISEIRG